MASDVGSVFAPYRPQTRPDVSALLDLRSVGDLPASPPRPEHAVRLGAARCDHPRPVTLAKAPPPLVRRCQTEATDVQDDQAGKLLRRALARRHKLTINQFGSARTSAELEAIWREATGRGEIPGAYWAALTHPAATRDTVRRAFREVHMLSHLVGAANRADIRRLRALERHNASLEERIMRQRPRLSPCSDGRCSHRRGPHHRAQPPSMRSGAWIPMSSSSRSQPCWGWRSIRQSGERFERSGKAGCMALHPNRSDGLASLLRSTGCLVLPGCEGTNQPRWPQYSTR